MKKVCKPCNIIISDGEARVVMVKAQGTTLTKAMIDCEIEIQTAYGNSVFGFATDLRLTDFKQIKEFVKQEFKQRSDCAKLQI